MEDPPSISEGCGGRVTDYRITDFGLLIQSNKLIPLKRKSDDQKPIEKMKLRLERHTKYWPLTINSTLLFNLKTVSNSRLGYQIFHDKKIYISTLVAIKNS